MILQNVWPASLCFPHHSLLQEYAERESEEQAAAVRDELTGPAARLKLPLFVMQTMYPGERIALNIFEPR